jgi:hypothetical protein
MFCHDTARNSDHKTRDCPILKKLGLKLEKRSKLDSNIDAATTVMAPPVAESAKPAGATPAPSSDAVSGSASLPGGFSAAAEQDLYDLGHEYDYEGKSSGSMYLSSSAKPKISHAYVAPTPLCCHVSSNSSTVTNPDSPNEMGGGTITLSHSVLHSLQDPQGVKTIYLPKTVLVLLKNPQAHKHGPTARHANTTLLVVDTGATDHMLLDKAAFISCYPVKGCCVRMGNNSFAPIIRQGTAIISLNDKMILITDCLHVPDLKNPLYSLRAHQHQ